VKVFLTAKAREEDTPRLLRSHPSQEGRWTLIFPNVPNFATLWEKWLTFEIKKIPHPLTQQHF